MHIPDGFIDLKTAKLSCLNNMAVDRKTKKQSGKIIRKVE